MKNFLLVAFLFGITACDDKIYYQIQEQVKEEAEVKLPFSGYFYLDGPDNTFNCIYLDEKQDGVVDIETDCQSLVSVNPENGTLGQFPSVSGTNFLVTKDRELRFTKNLRYTSGNDLETDASGSNITGTRRTDFIFKFVDYRLELTIIVYANANNDNLNAVVATRTFKEL